MNLSPAKCALIAACADAMFVDDDLTPALDPRLTDEFELVGYLTALNALFGTQAAGIGEREFYGFVARSKTDQACYVISIRGTMQAIEWLENLEGLLIANPRGPGKVEHGFWSIYDSMTFSGAPTNDEPGKVAHEILGQMLPPDAQVYVIGHSLGAALATYMMFELAQFNVVGRLFASPRPGDTSFGWHVNAKIRDYVVTNYIRDVVPHVPPSLPLLMDFQPLPNVKWITPATAQAVINDDPLCNHHALSYAAMLDSSYAGQCAATYPQCIGRKP